MLVMKMTLIKLSWSFWQNASKVLEIGFNVLKNKTPFGYLANHRDWDEQQKETNLEQYLCNAFRRQVERVSKLDTRIYVMEINNHGPDFDMARVSACHSANIKPNAKSNWCLINEWQSVLWRKSLYYSTVVEYEICTTQLLNR